MLRASCCAAFLFGACLAVAQDLNKPITYRTVAVPLHQALDDISKRSGITLFASEELQDEPVIVSVKGVSTQELIDRIAFTVDAQWKERSKSEFELYRSEARSQQLQDATVADRTKKIQLATDRLKKTIAPSDYTELGLEKTARSLAGALQTLDEDAVAKRGFIDARQAETILTRSPAHHFLIGLMQLLPVADLAKLDPGQGIIYSTSPTTGEVALPDGTADLLEEFVREQNLFAEAFARIRKNAHPTSATAWMNDKVAPVSADRLRIVLTVDRFPYGISSPSAHLLVIDGSKESGMSNVVDAFQSFSKLSPQESEKNYDDAKALAAKDIDVPLRDESRIVLDAINEATKAGWGVMDMTPPVKELLLHPDQRDPLSFYVSDAILYLADSRHKNLVAYPSDYMLRNGLSSESPGAMKLPTFLYDLPRSGIDLDEDQGWLILKPIEPKEEWIRRMNRGLLANCLREANERGFISIEAAAALANSEHGNQDSNFPEFYERFGEKYNPYKNRDRHLLRFYASLSQSQVDRLKSGAPLTVSDFSKVQYDRFTDLIYQSRSYSRMQFQTQEMMYASGGYELQKEPCEILPEGIPNTTSISMNVSNNDVFLIDRKADTVDAVMVGTITDIAYAVLQKGPFLADQTGVHNAAGIGWISAGQSRETMFNFDFGKGRTGSESLKEIFFSPDRFTLDTLPGDLKAKLAEAIKIAKQTMSEMESRQEEPPPQPPL